MCFGVRLCCLPFLKFYFIVFDCFFSAIHNRFLESLVPLVISMAYVYDREGTRTKSESEWLLSSGPESKAK